MEQLNISKRTNRIYTLGNNLTAIVYSLITVFMIIKGEIGLYVGIAIIVLTIVPDIMTFVAYFYNKDSKYIKMISVLPTTAAFIIALFSYKFITVPLLAFPNIILASAYLDTKYLTQMLAGTSIIMAAWGYASRNRADFSTNGLVELATVFSMIVLVFFITKLSEEMRKLNLEEKKAVLASKERQDRILQEINSAIILLNNNIEKLNTSIESIDVSSDAVNNAVTEISSGCENTTDNIEKQTKASKHIHEQIENAVNLAVDMKETSNNSKHVFKESLTLVSELADKSNRIKEMNEQVFSISNSLKEKTNKVQGIIDVITGISVQTNLLSLNAAIEAARAGESGKGFAVVADEVGKLAEQSKTSSENILNIIVSLKEEVDKALDSITKLSEVNIEEYQLVKKTEDNLNNLFNNISDVNSKVEVVADKVSEVMESNKDINESILNLSAISEQTLANSQETASIVAQYSQQTSSARQAVGELVKLSNDMKGFAVQ